MRAENIRKLYKATDIVNGKFGKHTLHLGGAHLIDQFGKGRRGGADGKGKNPIFRGIEAPASGFADSAPQVQG